jgi:glycosyltransferase involved in cell wall biosynthesis
MVNTLLTIVIPCKNSVKNLKKTVEDITKKTKSKGTRVLILDFGSVDGSYQYAAQASGELIRFLKIESIKMEKGQTIKNALDLIETPYVLVMTPGSTFKDPDLLISSINEVSKIAYPIAYLRRSDFINNIISTLVKNRRRVDAVFAKTQVLNILDYKYEDPDPEISFDDLSKGIKVGGFTD